jgi:putative endonuclease
MVAMSQTQKKFFYVYILASLSGTLYVGLTDDLPLRLLQHLNGAYDGFTRRHLINRLVYVEAFRDSLTAAAREKQIKKFRREKKIALFSKSNPKWKDLSRDLFGIRRAPSLRSGCF